MVKRVQKAAKKTTKNTYTNPDMDVVKRSYLSTTEPKFKAMLDLALKKMEADKNSEFKYCADCHVVAETRSGSDLHKGCHNVYTSRQVKGIHFKITLNNFLGSSIEETKENIIEKASSCGHVNERGCIRQLFFYSLIPNSTKYQLKKDHKRSIEQVQDEISVNEPKKFKVNGNNLGKEKPIQIKLPPRNQTEENKELQNDPRIQTIIQITFKKMDEVTELVKNQVKDLTKRISQIENKLTGLANKMKSIQQGHRGPQQTSSARGGARGGSRGGSRGGARGRRGRTSGRSGSRSNFHLFEEVDQELWDLWDQEEEDNEEEIDS